MKKAIGLLLALCMVLSMGFAAIPVSAADVATEAPQVFKISDEVKPGGAFYLHGWGLDRSTMVYVEKAETAGETPSEAARVLKPVLYDKVNTAYVDCVLPEGMEPAVYKVWAKNSYGFSNPILLNAPRIYWVGVSDIYWEGQTMQIVGVDFTADRFGAKVNTSVKLRVDGTDYPCEITELGPYSVKFTIPAGIKTGQCEIYLTNDGNTWAKMDNEQVISIVPKGNDPYNLGVAWADHYVYDYRLNIRDLGAVGDGVTDDTAAFNKAFELIRQNGGGVIYMPNGHYAVTRLDLPAYTVFEGESQDGTILSCIYKGTDSGFIVSADDSLATGYQGFYNLTITDNPATNYSQPDSWMWIGHPWTADGPMYLDNLRTFCGFFMKNVTRERDAQHFYDGTGRGCLYAIGDKYFLLEDMKCINDGTFMPSMFDYNTVRRTDQTPLTSNNESCGLYTIYEDNTIDMQTQHDKDTGAYAQGIFLRSDVYCTRLVIKNTGRPGNASPKSNFDGEVLCTENSNIGTIRLMGDVIGGEGTTLNVQPWLNTDGSLRQKDGSGQGLVSDNWSPCWGTYYVWIVDGKGYGQIRQYTGHTENEDGTFTVNIAKPWDIEPDETSKIHVATVTQRSVFYDNYFENCEKGVWFYGGMYDSIMADNTLVDVEGLLALSYHCCDSDMLWPLYFVDFIGNSMSGSCRLGEVNPTSIRAAVELRIKPNVEYIDIIGGSMRYNKVFDSLKDATKIKFTEGSSYNGLNIGCSKPAGTNYAVPTYKGLTQNFIVEGNDLKNVKGGIRVETAGEGATSGVLAKDNTYKNVRDHFKLDAGVENVVKINDR